jgi:hypothetical protein
MQIFNDKHSFPLRMELIIDYIAEYLIGRWCIQQYQWNTQFTDYKCVYDKVNWVNKVFNLFIISVSIKIQMCGWNIQFMYYQYIYDEVTE